MRKCGDCTLCCILFPVPEVSEEINKACQFCTTKCTIYDKRPQACKDFNCAWLLDEELFPEKLQPHKCNVIFERIPNTNIYNGLIHFEDLDVWKNKNVRNQIAEMNIKGFSVIISSYTDTPNRIFPSFGLSEKEVINEAINKMNN